MGVLELAEDSASASTELLVCLWRSMGSGVGSQMTVVVQRTASDLAGLSVVEIVLLGPLDGLHHRVGVFGRRDQWGSEEDGRVCNVISID